ncbi:hypothetical protein EMCRGX_G004307 [Ephydatia muelleri]|eukprot:Em0007g304a
MIFLRAAIALSLLVISRAETTLNPQQLLDAHLNYRAKVVPLASNMKPMTWDSQLAAKAQDYAQKCNWGHNPDRTSPLGKTGENIYMTTGSPSDCSVAVTSWNNEKDYYNYDTNVCQTGKVCGHYTQLVWASSNKVGCGAFRCPKLTGSASTNALLVVCNYYPAGNMAGMKPYVKQALELDSEVTWEEQNGEESEKFNNEEDGLYSETDDTSYEEDRASEEVIEEIVAELRSRLRGAKIRHHERN